MNDTSTNQITIDMKHALVITYRPEDELEINDWAKENNITCMLVGSTIHPGTFETHMRWFVPNDQDRTLFTLKWSKR